MTNLGLSALKRKKRIKNIMKKMMMSIILMAVCYFGMVGGDCYKSSSACRKVCGKNRCESCQIEKSQCLCTRTCYNTNITCLNNCLRCSGIPSQCKKTNLASCPRATLFTCPKRSKYHFHQHFYEHLFSTFILRLYFFGEMILA